MASTDAAAAIVASRDLSGATAVMLALEVGGYSQTVKNRRSLSTPSNSSEMFANHFATIAPHAAVMVVSPKDKSSSPTTSASKDRKKHRAKSERDAITDKKPVRIASRQTC
ncbi:hypothetical protein JG687_00005657 [Phytophthora cactorum]|uniref:Uncharacterized protein n=1 Tax=Phytophthora cactorum TaxID=29920 RepID=A0A8T1UQ14_9STRA|nr:hypothetical protein JG687_00005657 [Phytophthora cactorum]